jgi:isocitrate/isopropylmalate dehydrogenase
MTQGNPVKTYKIACIPGDGIGKEVIPAGQQVLQTLAAAQKNFSFDFTSFGWGGDWFRQHGVMMPDDGLDALRGMDAILFGSAGDPHIPDHITLWGLRLKICQGFDQYANVRPTRILPGIDAPLKRCTPQDLDWVIVRENSEGEYAGVGGRVHQGHPIEVATDMSILTRAGVERIMRFAFRLAQSRPRKLLTVVTKSNAQRHGMVMWDEIALQISNEFPDVRWDKELVDACTARMVNRPASLDTLVATNLHADRPGRRAGRQPGHCAHRQHRSREALPLDVRAHPWLGLRHHGPGPGESGRHLLVLRDVAGASRRKRRGAAPDAGDRTDHRRYLAAHPRPRRHGHHGPGDPGGLQTPVS